MDTPSSPRRMAHLTTACELDYVRYGREVITWAEIAYDFDGTDRARITRITCDGMNGYDDGIVERLCYEHVDDVCDEAYGEWLDERAEWDEVDWAAEGEAWRTAA